MIRSVSHVATMSPYALAQLNAPEGKLLISLAQNESLRPPSPYAIKAAAKALEEAHLYPDPEWKKLRAILSDIHKVPEESILCGSGSMQLIRVLAQAYSDEQNAVLAPAHGYPFFQTAAQMARARFDIAAEENGQVSIDALARAIRPDTRIVFVANPGNPTGTRIPRAEIVRLRECLPQHVLLVIDEAYGEFADHLNETTFDLVQRGDTVVLRTFSKAYGLAGMRVGWGVFPCKIAAEIRKVMTPNNISLAGQAAAAAALTDQTYMRQTCDLTVASRDGFRDRLLEAGFDVPESYTNFVLIRMPNAEAARRVDQALRDNGLFLRPQSGAGLGNCLRATIGDTNDLDTAARLLERWIRKEKP